MGATQTRLVSRRSECDSDAVTAFQDVRDGSSRKQRLEAAQPLRSDVDVKQEYSDCECEMGKNATMDETKEMSHSL